MPASASLPLEFQGRTVLQGSLSLIIAPVGEERSSTKLLRASLPVSLLEFEKKKAFGKAIWGNSAAASQVASCLGAR